MYYDRITRRVHIEIGGEEHLFAFTLSGLEQLESRAGTSLIGLITSGEMPGLSMLIDGFWIGLMGGGKRIKRDEAERLAQDYIDEAENGIGDLASLFNLLVAVSGIMGAKYANEVLKAMGLADKDGEVPEKNAKKAARK